MRNIAALAAVFVSGLAIQAFAYKGSISFTEQEKADHARASDQIVKVAAQCLEDHYADHLSFFERFKVSKYYGNRRYIKGEVPGKRADGAVLTPIRPELRKRGFNPDLEKQMTSLSCVDFARLCMKQGFESAGQGAYWEKIDAFNRLNGNIGPIIQVGLQALGWKMAYWNPDPSQNAAWDAADQARSPKNTSNVWGHHVYRYNEVMRKNKYYEYTIDDKTNLVGFGTQIPAVVGFIPFFVGTAHTGYHVFLGSYGEIIEAHSVHNIFETDTIERNAFNPLAGGAPMSTKSEVYRSGIIVVPPGWM